MTSHVAGFIPGPVLFGAIIDSTCVLWQVLQEATGACLFFDTQLFRYKIFGFSLLFQVFSSVFAFPLLHFVRKMVVAQREAEARDALIIKDSKLDKEMTPLVVQKISGV